MHHQRYGQLLLDAIRETLETMAFAEVVPYSMTVNNEELVGQENLSPAQTVPASQSFADSDGWGATPDSWGTTDDLDSASDGWGTTAGAEIPNTDTWGESAEEKENWTNPSPITDSMWENPLDAWGENVTIPIAEDVPQTDSLNIDTAMDNEPFNFDKLMNEQDDWCWSCLKVNSPELDAIWFLVSKKLALQLAQTMYAGDDFELDTPILRDIIAELTNVLGGRLMLLLEEVVGKFTLEVPQTGTGRPQLPDSSNVESVLCKVLVDNAYPVIGVMCFREDGKQ